MTTTLQLVDFFKLASRINDASSQDCFQFRQSNHAFPIKNTAGLRKLQTTMMEHVLALRNLDVNGGHLLVFVIAVNLDQETRKHLKMHEPHKIGNSEPQKRLNLLPF